MEHPAGSSCRSIWLQEAVCPPPSSRALLPPWWSNKDPRLCNDPHSPPLPPITALCAGARESFTCEPVLWSGAELTWPWAGCTWPGVPECVCAGGEALGPCWGGASGDTEETGEGWGHPAAGMPSGMGIHRCRVICTVILGLDGREGMQGMQDMQGMQGYTCVLSCVQLTHTHTHTRAHTDTHTRAGVSAHY